MSKFFSVAAVALPYPLHLHRTSVGDPQQSNGVGCIKNKKGKGMCFWSEEEALGRGGKTWRN